MKFNYNLEIDNILNKIYKRKIFDLACENNISNIDLKNIESYEITRAKIKSIRPNFIEGNLFDIVINKKFDNICRIASIFPILILSQVKNCLTCRKH